MIADSPSTPSFQPSRECIRLANPRNGRIRNLVSDNIYLPGHEVLFECDDQYELIGTSILTCMDNGTWSHPAPSCIRKYNKLTLYAYNLLIAGTRDVANDIILEIMTEKPIQESILKTLVFFTRGII